MKLYNLFAMVACVLVIASCTKESTTTEFKDDEFELYIDFWNPDGDNPQIRFDEANSSPEVKIDFSKTFAGVAVPPNFTNVIIENVRIIDDNGVNYHINEIKAYEWREDINDWKHDVEFVMEFDQVQDLNVMMVLDASASLGSDFANVKAFAKNFIGQVFDDISSAKIGVVDFSDVINSFAPTSNQTSLNSYIDGIEQGPFTTLYEAMAVGIDHLNGSSAESKAILTFTDGTDNNSRPQFTPSYIVNQLNNDPSGVGITSFTIGFDGNGGVDRPVLEQVTANGGAAAFPRTINELEVVFDRFSQQIATVYNLTYVRNQQVIDEATPAKLRFVLKSSPRQQ
ncbi:MAG: vWA domain-containing protein [Saprospiraceae bacterium]|nr:vWA domain-containing protein [Saprospiraceae bacterium]